MGIPESQWRTWQLDHAPEDGPREHRDGIGWQGCSTDTLLLLNICNGIELLRTQILELSGVKAEYVPLKPPGSKPKKTEKPHGGLSPSDILRLTKEAWENRG